MTSRSHSLAGLGALLLAVVPLSSCELEAAHAELTCRMTLHHVSQHDETTGEPIEREQTACIPIVDGLDQDALIPLDLPPDIADSMAASLQQGRLYVRIQPAWIEQETITLDPDARFTVVTEEYAAADAYAKSTTTQPLGVGDRTFAIVRISTSDRQPTDSLAALKLHFSSSTNINFKTQYDKCSGGALRWKPAATNAFVDLKVNKPIASFASPSELVTEAQNVYKAKMQATQPNWSWTDLAFRTIMCLPPSSAWSFTASAGVGHWRVQASNEWCKSLAGTMHELGHTLGLGHANESSVYDDHTGYMASGTTQADGPLKCFNGSNHWSLGWFENKRLAIEVRDLQAGQKGAMIQLAAFVDHAKVTTSDPVAKNNQYVVARIRNSDQGAASDLYLQYNRARDYNAGTGEAKDAVTVTTLDGVETKLVGVLAAGSVWTVPNYFRDGDPLVLKACRAMHDAPVSQDVMIMSIGKKLESKCPWCFTLSDGRRTCIF